MAQTVASAQRKFQSVNPSTNELIESFEFDSREEIESKINKGFEAFKAYKKVSVSERAARYLKFADILESHIDTIARTITEEMGKPIVLARGEVSRVAYHYKFYSQNAENFNKLNPVKTEADHSYIVFEPLGLIHIIIPFNFPFWLAFKAAASYMTIGNAVIVRGSDSTPRTTKLMKQFMELAGFGDEFQIVYSKQEDLEYIVSNPKIRGVSFTGSSAAGSIIASTSGKYLKKCVMELGGSDPFILLEDANVDFAVEIAIKSRLKNGGQVCNSSKRFLIHQNLYESFKKKLIEYLQNVKIGDPLHEDTELGPLARKDLVDNLQKQIKQAIDEDSATLLYGNKFPQHLQGKYQSGFFLEPVVMEVKNLNSVIMREETFGPLFALYKIKDAEEALQIANSSEYGLGSVIIAKDTYGAEKIAREIECGMAMINQVSLSDTRCSSGGVKRSGYGRECGEWGCHEFANIKTVWVEEHK
ncbi:hypothetical protein ABPG74_019632 [Tetrahymena malaccensis]